MGLNVGCVLILSLGLKIETPKSNEHSLEFGTTFVRCLLMILLIKCAPFEFNFQFNLLFKLNLSNWSTLLLHSKLDSIEIHILYI